MVTSVIITCAHPWHQWPVTSWSVLKKPRCLVARPRLPDVSPCDGELSCLVLARQVSPGQEPLTYIFTFLSSLPRSQVLRQSETRWQDTGIHHWPVTTQHQAWQWEVNKAQHWKSGYFMEPKFLASVKQLLHLAVIIPTLVLWIVGPQNIISLKHILDKTKTSIKV